MMNPCIEFCYNRFGKEYSEECNTTCTYAQEVLKRKQLEKRVIEITGQLDEVIAQCKDSFEGEVE